MSLANFASNPPKLIKAILYREKFSYNQIKSKKMQPLILKKNEERRLLAGHLWIFSNEIDTKQSPLKNFQTGELVTIQSSRKQTLGIGYINPNTLLSARLLTRSASEKIDTTFFVKRIQNAMVRRERYFTKPFYRAVFGESDLLPGLVVDRFGDTLVVQITAAGLENFQSEIIEALLQVVKPKAILWRNDSGIRATESLPEYVSAAYGNPAKEILLEENSCTFYAPIWEGQKTGWFYDQRFNRARLAPYVANARVLDVCSYVGAFGINAAYYGAKQVTCIDSSEFALQYLKRNAKLNQVENKISVICNDVFAALKDLKENCFEVIIVDPPAFIKKRKDLETGTAAYLYLFRLALQLLAPNGILLATSCSLHFSRDLMLDTLRKASRQSGRDAVILEELHQASDHPVHLAIPETNYLKGFILS